MRRRRPRRSGPILDLIALIFLLPTWAAGGELSFLLVPKNRFEAIERGSLPFAGALSDGEILLYREGDDWPRRSVRVGEPVLLEQGTWIWRGEAAGWLSTWPGVIKVEEVVDSGAPRIVVWPVVPACRASLTDGDVWSGIQRIDVVSLSHGSVHRLSPVHRRETNIPAGRFLYYTVDARGIRAISRIVTCSQDQQVVITPPPSPSGDRVSLIVHVSPPAEAQWDPLAMEIFLRHLRAGVPDAVVVAGPRTTAFFLDRPVWPQAEVVLSHPEFLTERAPIEREGGAVLEVGPIELSPRFEVDVPVDYRPLDQHRNAVLELWEYHRGGGEELVAIQELAPGVQTYRFEGLDAGYYDVRARIDQEILEGLGVGIKPQLRKGRPIPEFPLTRLQEFEITGRILVDGEPVPGEVRIVRTNDESVRKLTPIGEGLQYRLTYFGRAMVTLDPATALPGDDSRPIEQRLGLPRFRVIQACAAGRCRTLSPAVIRAGGELDIPISSRPRIVVEIRDRTTGDPLGKAEVILKGENPHRLVFTYGRADWSAPNPANEVVFHHLWTDTRGRVEVTSPPPRKLWIEARLEGYEPVYQEIGHVPADADLRVVLELTPKRRQSILLRTTNGEMLSGALVVPVTSDGSIRRDCAALAGHDGRASLRATCRGEPLLVFHPGARLAIHPASRIWEGELEIPAVDRPPVRLRLVDGDGEPLERAFLDIVLEDLTLSTDTLLFARSRTELPWPYSPDRNGEVVLFGLDGSRAVELVVELASGEETVLDLTGFVGATTHEVVVDP